MEQSQIDLSKDLADISLQGQQAHNTLPKNHKGMVKTYYNLKGDILLEHNLSGINGSETSLFGGSASSNKRRLRYDPYCSNTQAAA